MFGRDAISFESPPRVQDPVAPIPLERIFEIGSRIAFPGIWRSEELNQFQGCFRVIGRRCDPGAADVDVSRLREDHGDVLGQGLVLLTFAPVQHASDVVRVDDGNPAGAFANSLNLRGVLGKEFLADVGSHALNPLGCRSLTSQNDLIGHKGLIVWTLAIAQAQFAFELGVGEIGVGLDAGRINKVSIDNGDSGATCQGIPLAIGVAKIVWNQLIQFR